MLLFYVFEQCNIKLYPINEMSIYHAKLLCQRQSDLKIICINLGRKKNCNICNVYNPNHFNINLEKKEE